MKKILLIFSYLLVTCSIVMGQTVQITGTVTSSEDGLALPGVNVTVKGTTIGAITSADGKYFLTAPASAQTLIFSFIGYRTQELPIGGKTKVDATLVQDVYNVEEVVVVAYGTQQKRDITGSVASVPGKSLNIPVQSFDQALQGKAAGVSITLPNGVLNNVPVIRIRGVNSISSSSYPLIVVDGVPVFTGDVSSSAAYANALADINPSDIQSMDILKDASATALYGSRASNGVILITTKHGTSGKTRVTYDGYAGFTEPYHLFKMMNVSQYLEHKNRAWINLRGETAPQFTDPLDANGKPIDTKWSDWVYRKGFQQGHSITVSGQAASTSYFLSVGYTDQDGMMKTNSYTRKNARLNLDQKVNKFLSLGANIAYTNGFNRAPDTGSSFSTGGAARLAFVLPPNLAPYLNDGSYNISNGAIGNMGQPIANYGYYNPESEQLHSRDRQDYFYPFSYSNTF
jgi:TonB-linked SusC/RagA family outer membrane protein